MVTCFLLLVEDGYNSHNKTKQKERKKAKHYTCRWRTEWITRWKIREQRALINSLRSSLYRATRIPHSSAYSFPGYCPFCWFWNQEEFWNPGTYTHQWYQKKHGCCLSLSSHLMKIEEWSRGQKQLTGAGYWENRVLEKEQVSVQSFLSILPSGAVQNPR